MKTVNDILKSKSTLNEEMEVKKMEISPEMAKEMLETMESNRDYKPTVGSKYARDMENDRWYLSPNPISFDENGHLMDGQHRLNAIVNSGKPEPFLIALNVSRDTPIDIHKQRTTSDNLIYSGRVSSDVGCTKNLAVVNALLKARISGTAFNSYSDFDKQHVLEKYKNEIVTARSISQAGKHSAILKKAAIQSSFVSAIVAGADITKIYDFAESANSGLPVGENPNPALVASRMIFKLKLTRRQLMSVVEQALSDSLSGKTRKRNYDLDGDLPFSDQLSLEEIMN